MSTRRVGMELHIDIAPVKLEMEEIKKEQVAIRANQGAIYSENIYLYTQMAQLAGMWLGQFRDIAGVEKAREALQLAQMVMYMRRLKLEIIGQYGKQNYLGAALLTGVAISYAALYLKTKAEQEKRKDLDAYMNEVGMQITSWS